MAENFENKNYGNRFNNGGNNFRKVNSKNYVKEFTDFNEGYASMIDIIPEIKVYGGDVADYDTVIQNLANSIAENVPSYDNPNYPNTLSFSISSREVGFLTDEKLAFGWRIYYNREINKRIYQMRITFLNFSMNKRNYIFILENNGWQENENISKVSPFIRSISNNKEQQRFNNNRNFNNRSEQQSSFTQQEKEPKEVDEETEGEIFDVASDEHEIQEVESKTETQEETTVESQLENDNKSAVESQSEEVEEEAETTDTTTEEQDDDHILSDSELNPNDYNITKTASDNVFVIQYKNKNFVVNIIDDSEYPDDLYVDHGERVIGYKEVKYDYKTCEVFIIDSEKDEAHKTRVFAEIAEMKRMNMNNFQ